MAALGPRALLGAQEGERLDEAKARFARLDDVVHVATGGDGEGVREPLFVVRDQFGALRGASGFATVGRAGSVAGGRVTGCAAVAGGRVTAGDAVAGGRVTAGAVAAGRAAALRGAMRPIVTCT